MTMRQQTCMITGGAGFIGSELTRLAAEKFAKVVVVDNLVNGKRENIADLLSANVVLEVVDIRDQKSIRQLLQGVHTVFHLACLGVRHSIHSPRESHDVNAAATLDLLESARGMGVKKFVYVSTSEVYGSVDPLPPMTETHHTYPMTVYGAAKLAGECYTRAYHRTYGYPTVVVRPFNAYGPRCHHEGDSGEVIPKFMLRCMAGKPMVIFDDGNQTRDFTFVTDTARGILMAGFSDQAVGYTINLGSGKEIKVNLLAKLITEILNKPDAPIIHDEPRPGDVYRLCADTTRARQLLGFEPEVTLREGLSKLKDWYVGQGKTPEELLAAEVVRNWVVKASTTEE